jgi:hypothetical protein
MKKLGIASKPHVKSVDFDRYVKLFSEGLSEEQARQINELLGFVLAPEGVVDVDDVERPGC